MNNKQLIVIWITGLLVSCAYFPLTPDINMAQSVEKADLYLHFIFFDDELNITIPQYEQDMIKYLNNNPDIPEDIARYMFKGIVVLGMTEKQVLAIYKPHRILDGLNGNEKIFQYSDVYFGGDHTIEHSEIPRGEKVSNRQHGMTTIWITLKNGIVTDMREQFQKTFPGTDYKALKK